MSWCGWKLIGSKIKAISVDILRMSNACKPGRQVVCATFTTGLHSYVLKTMDSILETPYTHDIHITLPSTIHCNKVVTGVTWYLILSRNVLARSAHKIFGQQHSTVHVAYRRAVTFQGRSARPWIGKPHITCVSLFFPLRKIILYWCLLVFIPKSPHLTATWILNAKKQRIECITQKLRCTCARNPKEFIVNGKTRTRAGLYCRVNIATCQMQGEMLS